MRCFTRRESRGRHTRRAARRDRPARWAAPSSRSPGRGADQRRRTGNLCADACEAAGLSLWRRSRTRPSPRCARSCLGGQLEQSGRHARLGSRRDLRKRAARTAARPGVDAVIVLFVPPVVAGADEVAAAIVRAVEPEAVEASRACLCDQSDGDSSELWRRPSPRRLPGVCGACARACRRARRVVAASPGPGACARRHRPAAARVVVDEAGSGGSVQRGSAGCWRHTDFRSLRSESRRLSRSRARGGARVSRRREDGGRRCAQD